MNYRIFISILIAVSAAICARAQNTAADDEKPLDTRYALSILDDATFYGSRTEPIPEVLNQVLTEPEFSLRYRDRITLAGSLIGLSGAYSDTYTDLRVREAYTDLSAGDLDLTAGRRLVRWGTGYAFTAAGVLDPPRIATDPTDRLSVNEGRDMVKAEWIHNQSAVSFAWSTAQFAPKGSNMRDTVAFRYNFLMRGFDTSLIAGNDRGGDSFGALTFTRVFGEAWEVHGEAAWREQAAALLGAKYTVAGIDLIGEFYSPPNIPYYRDAGVSPLAGRQHYAFFSAGKARLRELPGWKEWSVSGAVVANLDDRSYTPVFDASRWFGNHFSAYVHLEAPHGSRTSEYGSAPYSTATSVGVRFQL